MPALADQVAALQELDRRECFADPTVMLERHVSIEDTQGQIIPLRLWDFQRQAIRALHEDRLVIVLKARRLGLSWIYLAYALWLAITSQGVRILILCKNEGDAAALLDRIRRMRDRLAQDRASAHLLADLPAPPKGERDAVTTLDVGTSTIKALVATPAAARSETAGLLLLDEFAFANRAKEIWRGALPTIDGGGRVGVISTGDGPPATNFFADLWTKANAGLNELVALFFPWQARPDRDQAWKNSQVRQLGEEGFRVEFPETPDDAWTAPDTINVFDHAAIDAAVRLGAQLDQQRADRTLPPPVSERTLAGVDWGDFRTHAVAGYELERGGLYVPAELEATQADVEDITTSILAMLKPLGWWVGEERYDAAFKQSNRTFARTAEAALGPHNPVRKTGRPNTVPIPFAKYKSLAIGYLRYLLRRTAAGETTRVLAISPRNTVLLEQLRGYQQDPETGKPLKGDDDAVDSLIALVAPIARRHRDLTDIETA